MNARRPEASWVALAIVGLAAIGLRFYGLDHLPGINGDEPQYAVHAHSLFAGASLISLRTGSDLPMNPVFFGPVVALQALLPHTLWTLRLAAVVQSLATIGFALWLFRARGRLFASVFALLLATLPANLAYARFAWDPTAIPTASILALAAATRPSPLLTLLASGLLLWVHPTGVFLIPVLLAALIALKWPRDEQGRIRRFSARQFIALVLVVAGAVAALVFAIEQELLPTAVLNRLQDDLVAESLQRAAQPLGYAKFGAAFVDLLSGPTVYRYIVGSMRARAADLHYWLALLVIAALTSAGVWQQHRQRRSADLSVFYGLLVALLIEYVIAGPRALRPHTERYAMCLTVPACYVLAGFVDVLASTSGRARALRWGTVIVGAALLASFGSYYLARFHRTNPGRADTFRTGAIDPKRKALEALQQMRDPSRTALVYVEDWWIYWTVRYLAAPETGVRVTIQGKPWNFRFPVDYQLPTFDPKTMEKFAIAWADRSADGNFAKQSLAHTDIRGYERGVILRVHKLRPFDKRRKRPK